jgi:uncharacterized protein (TIGR00369 family)
MDQPSVREAEWLAQGYVLWKGSGRFVPAIARVFQRTEDSLRHFRIELRDEHSNGAGRVHGGFISTLADIWLAGALADRLPADARFVTASLQVDFLEALWPGDWIESSIDWCRPGKRLCQVAGRMRSAERDVVAMRAVFSILSPARQGVERDGVRKG